MLNLVDVRTVRLPHLCIALLTCILTLSLHGEIQAQESADPFGVAGFDCGRISELGIDKQLNMRASAILRYCETGRTDLSESSKSLAELAYEPLELPLVGGTDINLITGGDSSPRVIQAESVAWSHGNTIVVAYDDSRGAGGVPISYCGVSVSTNGGATFTRLSYLFNATGQCLGDPSLFYSVRAGKWFIGFIASRCGSSGIGQWESPDGVNWSESGCYMSTGTPDVFSAWVDNNPSSPFYGRQYGLFNNFALTGGALQLVHSSDDGGTWSAPVTIFGTGVLRRAVKVFGSLGPDGTVFAQSMDEGGGGTNNRTNVIFRSTTGGASWSLPLTQGAAFPPPGRSFVSYFPGMYTTPIAGYWRYMGWGQPGVGPANVVHYVYSARPSVGSMDPGNIYYVRSTDSGTTWSLPVQLNSDATIRAQFQPALAVNASGKLVATWYDERNTATDAMQRFVRTSIDAGATWSSESALSDVIFPKPLQPDPLINSVYVGDRHDAAFNKNGYGNIAYDTWTDGRVSINGSPQQDVFFDRVSLATALFDFDGDGRSDISIFRPSVSQWWINRSSNGSTFAAQFGASTDRIVPADYTGDGKTDIAVWRPATGTWFVLRSEDFSFFSAPFGISTDTPVPADYDSDGKADLAIFRSGEWFIQRSTGGTLIQGFGTGSDLPVPADYDGDARADLAIFRPSNGQWWLNRSTAGLIVAQFGTSTDDQVPADYTGDGKTDVAFWRPGTGTWFVLRSEDFSFFSAPFGVSTDLPAPGDYDGDGRTDLTVFRPASGTWFSQRTTAGILTQQFGVNGDRPVPNAFVR